MPEVLLLICVVIEILLLTATPLSGTIKTKKGGSEYESLGQRLSDGRKLQI
jgi:hypothetical protein